MEVSTTETTLPPQPSEVLTIIPKRQNMMPTDAIETVNNSGSGKPLVKEPGSNSSIDQRLAKKPGSDDSGGKLAKEPGSRDQRLAKESSSSGKRFACDECDYSGRLPHHLKGHKRTHHEIVWLGCQLCDYQVRQLRTVVILTRSLFVLLEKSQGSSTFLENLYSRVELLSKHLLYT